MGYHDAGLVCENGHAINGSRTRHIEFNTKFCSTCGAKALGECVACGSDIRGEYHCEGVVVVGSIWNPPNHCHECGAEHPWVEKKAEAVRNILNEMELEDAERQGLQAAVPDIVADTPNSEVAAMRFRKILGKAGGDILQKVLIGVATAAARQSMGI